LDFGVVVDRVRNAGLTGNHMESSKVARVCHPSIGVIWVV
jgi:hypothetical protein